MHPGGLSGASRKADSTSSKSTLFASCTKASVGPVSPLYTMVAPVAFSSTRMPYASTGCATRTVRTVNGPICWLGCQVRQSRYSSMDSLNSPPSPSWSTTSYARAIREAALAGRIRDVAAKGAR